MNFFIWKKIYYVILLYCMILFFYKGVNAKGAGFAFSGAGGRISQHVALMEVLVKGLYPSGIKNRPVVISGASSGALSAVALNAILETEDKKIKDGFTWEEYKKIIFELQNSQVFDDSYEGLAKIFFYNVQEGYILDNTPLKNTLKNILKKFGYEKLGDLYIPTCLSIMNQTSGFTERLWSDNPEHAKLDLLEVLMASTALPLAFTPAKITGLYDQDTIWIDGATGIDSIPVIPLLTRDEVSELYLICYGSALVSGGGKLPDYLDFLKLLKNGLAAIEDMRVELFDAAFRLAAQSDLPAYVYMPNLNKTFSVLDFESGHLQYSMTKEWAERNNPRPIHQDPTSTDCKVPKEKSPIHIF
jgi:predicted acylesterase/phospholipase RssA